MIALDENSVADALMLCYNGVKYKVGIAFSTQKRMHDFASSLERQQREGLVPATHYRHGNKEILFGNGSSIEMVNACSPGSLYGRSYDFLLYDTDITDKDTLAYLEACERTPLIKFKNGEYIRTTRPEMEIDPQPLDDFLSGFEIIKA